MGLPPGVFRFTCPACNAGIRTKDSTRGQSVRCPKCREPILVPTEGSTVESLADAFAAEYEELTAPQSESPIPAHLSSPPPVRLRQPVDFAAPNENLLAEPAYTQTRTCPFCVQQIAFGAAKCHHCGEFLVGPQKSDFLAGCLGFLLGPVGLWYKGHWAAGFAWLVMGIIIGSATGFLAFPVFWIGMAVHAAVAKPKR